MKISTCTGLPLSEKQVEQIKGLKNGWGVTTDETEIDTTIYGAEECFYFGRRETEKG